MKKIVEFKSPKLWDALETNGKGEVVVRDGYVVELPHNTHEWANEIRAYPGFALCRVNQELPSPEQPASR